MKGFESGVLDYLKIPITLEVSFPINTNGQPVIACKYCRLFTGNRCIETSEVIYQPDKYVGFDCPLKQEVKEDV